MRQVASNFDAK